MSSTIDTAFVKQYEAEVKEAYQRMGAKLRHTIRNKAVTNAKDVTFQKYATATATTKGRHGLISVSDTAHTNVTATLSDYYTGEWVDSLDELKTNIDERGLATRAGAYALGRQTDQLIITALDTMSTNSSTLTTTSKATFKNSVLVAVQKLNSGDVPDDGNRWGIVSPITWSWLMLINEFVSADYITDADLPFKTGTGGVRFWYGVKWMVHSGLTISTNTRNNLLFHESAAGIGTGAEVKTDVTWHGDRAAYFIANSMSMGAVLIDGIGGCEMPLDESVALATS